MRHLRRQPWRFGQHSPIRQPSQNSSGAAGGTAPAMWAFTVIAHVGQPWLIGVAGVLVAMWLAERLLLWFGPEWVSDRILRFRRRRPIYRLAIRPGQSIAPAQRRAPKRSRRRGATGLPRTLPPSTRPQTPSVQPVPATGRSRPQRPSPPSSPRASTPAPSGTPPTSPRHRQPQHHARMPCRGEHDPENAHRTVAQTANELRASARAHCGAASGCPGSGR